MIASKNDIRQKLLDVAVRCTNAERACFSIDRHIYALQRGRKSSIPKYTRSMDAAMSLIPKDHDYVLEHVNGGLTIGARVGHNIPEQTSWGDTAALAMCAAALRAQADLV